MEVTALRLLSSKVGSKWRPPALVAEEQEAPSLAAVNAQHVQAPERYEIKRHSRCLSEPVRAFSIHCFASHLIWSLSIGAEDGMIIRGPSGGDAPLVGKGPKGDLLVRLKVASSPIFQRQGSNLYHQSKVPFHRALLGGVVRVPTLDGEVDVRMPVGTQQGEEMVLKGRGIASKFEGRTGDLFVTFSLQLPR